MIDLKDIKRVYFRKGTWFLLIIIFLSIVSCNKGVVPEKTEANPKVLSGKDYQNYTYLFSEALKQKLLGNIQKSVSYYDQCLKINPASDAAIDHNIRRLYFILDSFMCRVWDQALCVSL